MDTAAANAIFEQVLAPWVKELGLVVETAGVEQTTLRLPESPRFIHGGGVVSGQTLMAAADSAMVVAFSAALGGFRPMTTVNLNMTFLRPISKGDMRIVARVVRTGKNLLYGDVDIIGADGRIAAHATTTYALV
ncbi:MAG: PaaI family thioesterase [Betaproteobacteria bacterium]